jgi:UDP-2,4-diacetamido-2,4,6-trideoxy-beta-L-altropyranose hydrolase
MKIIIRADGGINIGMGHVMRTLVLADHLSEFAEVVYACRAEDEFHAGREYIRQKGFKVIEISQRSRILDIQDIKADCLITDSYDVNENYFNETKKSFVVTGYIDDLNTHRYDVDFIINQNSYAEDLYYSVNTHTKLFLGSRYALLREEFINLPRKDIRKNVEDIMITMGGSDNNNLTKTIIDNISIVYPNLNLHVVMGPSFIYKQALKSMENDKIVLYSNPKMSDIMQKCDVAIAACGSTLYELAASGTPTIGVTVADNQRRAAKRMEDLGIILYAKSIQHVADNIEKMDYEKRMYMANIGQNHVDGLGGYRLAKEIETMLLELIN